MSGLEDDKNLDDDDSEKNNRNLELNDAATQRADGDDGFPSGDDFKDDGFNDYLNLTSTMPVDETFLLEDAFETQLALAGETQVLDDLDCMEHMPRELFDMCNAEVAADRDSEGTIVTEVLCDTEEVSRQYSAELDDIDSIGHDNAVDSFLHERGDNVFGAPSGTFKAERRSSGPICRGFTSIRTASIRASGLAARARGSTGNMCSPSNDRSTIEQQSEQTGSSPVGDVSKPGTENNGDISLLEGGDEGQGNRNENSRKAFNTAARKLFVEDGVGEVDDSDSGMNHNDSILNIPENGSAGLSYAHSQEPGELSQANALEVVDKFLEQNIFDYRQDFEHRVHIAENSDVVTGTTGCRDLAKSSIAKSTDRKHGVYDWDDTREDDGGGEFFSKKKELFFGNGDKRQRSLTEPVKQRCSNLRKIKPVADHGDEDVQTHRRKSLGDPVNLASEVMLHKLRAKGKSICHGKEAGHKNLSKELDKQAHMASRTKLTDNDRMEDVPSLENVGPDTQLVAEVMETLCFEVNLLDDNGNNTDSVTRNTKGANEIIQSGQRVVHLEESLTNKIQHPNISRVTRQQAKQTNRTSPIAKDDSSCPLLRQSKRTRKQQDEEIGMAEQRRLERSNCAVSSCGKECRSTPRRKIDAQEKQKSGRSISHENDPSHGTELTSQGAQNQHPVQEKLGFSVPIAPRTRKRTEMDLLKDTENSLSASKENDHISAPILRKKRTAAKGKSVQIITIDQLRKLRSAGFKQSDVEDVGTSGTLNVDTVQQAKGKRTREGKLAVGQEADRHDDVMLKKRRSSARISGGNHLSIERLPEKELLQKTVGNEGSRSPAVDCDSGRKTSLNDETKSAAFKKIQQKSNAETLKSAEGIEKSNRRELSPREKCVSSAVTCTTPSTIVTPRKEASPICMGDEYYKQSCRKNLSGLSLVNELNNLISGSPEPFVGIKEVRKRRDITNIRVLFSQHLDVDVTKQQKKILARLGATVASTISDATHFVADEFVRTRNILEAIAFGKPVVTHMWVESCGQAGCLLDEKSYILRDTKKEKEFGFSMPVSLSRACQHPLLQGHKVFITPNTKPGKDILSNLVKAVHGLAVERLGRSALKDEKLPDDLLILSCEEDYGICLPFLEKGAAVYSSELLLNGIVKQKLEYERHRLFADHVKRTRSTIWVRKKDKYLPSTKVK